MFHTPSRLAGAPLPLPAPERESSPAPESAGQPFTWILVTPNLRQFGCRIHVFRAADLTGAGFRHQEFQQHATRADGVATRSFTDTAFW